MRKVILLGTGHRIQVGKQDTIRAFEARLHALCNDYAVRAIGEEMSCDLLARDHTPETVAHRVATKLGIPHRYCDPPLSERLRLGTTTVNGIDVEAEQLGWSDEEIAKRLAAHFVIVETYWLDEIADLNVWPMLFVCGANHVATFSRRALQRGHEVVVTDKDWGA